MRERGGFLAGARFAFLAFAGDLCEVGGALVDLGEEGGEGGIGGIEGEAVLCGVEGFGEFV